MGRSPIFVVVVFLDLWNWCTKSSPRLEHFENCVWKEPDQMNDLKVFLIFFLSIFLCCLEVLHLCCEI